MLSKKYHAIAFVSILVMLLLLGLHLLGLGFGFGGGGGGSGNQPLAAAASSSRSAALARNSSSSSPPTYEHPIAYDKLTGATNNQISEVLGNVKRPAEASGDLPLDHYQQQQQQQHQQQIQQLQQQQQQQQQNQRSSPFGGSLDDFFAATGPASHHHMRAGPPPLGAHPMQQQAPMLDLRNQMLGAPQPPAHHQLMQMRPPPPPPPPPSPPQPQPHANQLMPTSNKSGAPTTQAPASNQQRQLPFNANQQGDSIPLASSLDGAQPSAATNSSGHQQSALGYYTPPIFAYNNNNNQYFGQPVDIYQQQQPPVVGVPEVPLSIDEYNARQARLRQLAAANQQQQHQLEPTQLRNHQPPPPRHQQQLMFASGDPPTHHPANNQSASYYPDPALYGHRPMPVQLMGRAPYAQLQQSVNNNNNNNNNNNPNQRLMLMAPEGRAGGVGQPPTNPNSHRSQPTNGQLVAAAQTSGRPPPALISAGDSLVSSSAGLPTCARQQTAAVAPQQLELANSSTQLPVNFCTDDPEYPTREIMRALETFALDRSIEQLLPQSLVQALVVAPNGGGGGVSSQQQQQQQQQPATGKALAELRRQLAIDSLQPELYGNGQQLIDSSSPSMSENSSSDSSSALARLRQQQFPSNNYEQMCKSLVYVAQPKRAKTLHGQWKILVNLPGHKYRGIAISQMVRIEECSRPNGECQQSIQVVSTPSNTQLTQANTRQQQQAAPATAAYQIIPLPRSRCLQQYENHRLLAWSNQQGLHLDIFRLPSACSCHLRRQMS